MKIKLTILALILGIITGGYVVSSFTKTPVKTKPHSSSRVVLDKPDVQIKKINNRGDIKVTTPSNNYTVKTKKAKNKIGIDCSPQPEIGYSYELLAIGDFSLNVGCTWYSLTLGLNYSLNPHTEVGIGVSNAGAIASAKFRMF